MGNIRPTSDEIHSYFKNAVTVQCINDSDAYRLDWSQDLDFYIDSIRILNQKDEPYSGTNTFCQLWSKSKGYAKILTYKTKEMKITKENIIKLDKKETTVRELFPEFFKTALNVRKWYKHEAGALAFKTDNSSGYGFNYKGKYETDVRNYSFDSHPNNWTPATTEEVFEALKGEAVRMGFKEGNVANNSLVFNSIYSDYKLENGYFVWDGDILWWEICEDCRYRIFHNGKWAAIIPVKEMTQSQIENELGYKIKIV